MERFWIPIALVLAAPSPLPQEGAPREVRLGVVIDGPWSGNDEVTELFQTEIRDLLEGEFTVVFPEEHFVVADWTTATIAAEIDRLLAAPDVDLVLATSLLSSNDIAHRTELPKPVVASFVIDPLLQGIPYVDGKSGRENLTYITTPSETRRDLERFGEIVTFDRVAILIDRTIYESIPGLATRFQESVVDLELGMRTILVDDSAEPVLAELTEQDQAVYVAPLLRLPPAEFDELITGLTRRRLPSFSIMGRSEVERGLYATIHPRRDFRIFARRTAINVQRILLGEPAAEIGVHLGDEERMVINMETARAIGAWPRWNTLTEAELIGDARDKDARVLDLTSAMREAVAANLDLGVAGVGVRVGEASVRAARAPLLPQLEANVNGAWINSERAAGGFTNGERTWAAGLTLRQILYADDVHAGFDVERFAQTGRVFDRNALELDVALDAALTYLDVLRSATLMRIQRDNLNLTRSNLELAQTRLDVGVADASEVYRWESEVAAGRSDILAAMARLEQAKVALNRLLNRPLEEEFRTVEASIDDPHLVTSDPRVYGYLDNPWLFRIFRDFLVREGMEKSPELRALEAGIAAQDRLLTNSRRAFWIPDVSLQAQIAELIASDGLGAAGDPPFGDTEWSLGVVATLPLTAGGGLNASREGARRELRRLRLQWEATRQAIESNIRTALHATSSSYPAIELSQAAAEAARKNLELVQDSYAQGAVSIIKLLDAQNAALVSDQVSANAVFDFLSDLMRVQRAVGNFDALSTIESREAWFARLQAYYAESGAEPLEMPDED